MSLEKPSWLEEEAARAETLNEKGITSNRNAPQIIKVKREPPRKQRNIYVQDDYWYALNDLINVQKKVGNRAPKLVEEAILMLLKKYDRDTSQL